MASPKVKIGLMGTANIASKNKRGIDSSGVAELYAVASRSLEKAKAWAEAHGGVTKAYGSYEELLADPDVQAVYIPLPCAMHFEWAVKTARAGKAVLIEKPTAVSAEELATIVSACRENNVQFMDGTMFNHHSRMPLLRAFLDSPACGPVVRMSSGFTFQGDADFHANNIRVDKKLEPFGSLGDLGWYNIRFALWAMGWALPTHVRARAEQWSAAGVPIDVTAQLVFGREPGSPQMLFDCGFTTPFRQWMEVSGAQGGVLRLDDFVITRSHASCEFATVKNPGLDALHSNVLGEREVVEVRGCNQEAEMWRVFGGLVASGTPDPHWPRIALLTQAVLDACMRSIEGGGKDVDVVAPAGGGV